MIYKSIFNMVGNTPIINLKGEGLENINFYAKLEGVNPTGSVKDRAAQYIINKVEREEMINKDTIIIESSSGNFGIALSAYCKSKGLNFYCVIDPLISETNEMLIRKFSSKVIKVTERDKNGAYLLTRIKKVNDLIDRDSNSYWVNQYANEYNCEAYYNTLALEMCNDVENIDYVFVGVSSGGTITGVSRKVKKVYPNAKVIAVDIVGSVIFGGEPQKRYIPGIGSSKVPEILRLALIDEVMTIDERDVVRECNNLLLEHKIFAGGSSGAVFAAVKKYFKDKSFKTKPNVVTLFADRGDRYANTVYDEEWCNKYIFKNENIKVAK
ncbi:2,3-diaminopropionate biosynthesis protein SbnA [Clostridium sp. UBA6640]|uniref:2,3-diaminopropionate biosynthesis protein SbnA n=1 Tax=Clostridium sp. UBA6640 TaxID=1946370 RepID=UPI0025BE120C|nr:2,3-diaminopropionate biosynthesis protein SbnA [Clostridium sp. UBA6640]